MTAIRVYEYGLLPPHTNAALVNEQMLRAHRYRNMLVEIERDRRQKIRAAMAAHPDLAPLEERLRSLCDQRDKLREEIQAQRRRTRSRSESADQRQAVKDLTAQIKPLRETVNATRTGVARDSSVKEAMVAAEEDAKARLKKARSECGVYWGTYLLQEQAADQARRERTPPKFVRWNGEGRVSVQIQKGIPLADLWGAGTQVQIQPVHPDAWDQTGTTRRGVRRRLSRTVLRLRVGSEGAGNRIPIWAEWRMIMHRAIPDGARIKVATVSRRRRDCTSWDWRVQLTVDVSACEVTRPAPASGAVALNLGFCQRGPGVIRSGYLVGDDGFEREILVTKSDDVRVSRATQRGPVVHPGETGHALHGHDVNCAQTDSGMPRHVNGTYPEQPEAIGTRQGRRLDELSHAMHGQLDCQEQPGTTGTEETSGRTGHAERGLTGGAVDQRGGSATSTIESSEQTSPGDTPGLSRTVPNWIINGLTKADSIRSFRDKALDAMKAILCTWRAGNDVDREAIVNLIAEWSKGRARPDAGTSGPTSIAQDALPEWFVKGTEALHAWRSAERFRRLVEAWSTQRFAGDEAVFSLMSAWRERDEHLERYESGLRRSALRDRRESYRIVAAQMAARYRVLIIDDTDLSQFQRSPSVESKEVAYPAVKRQQRYAAGSELRGVMINAFGEDRVVRLSHKDMTRRCHQCGHINHWDRLEHDRYHTCDGCGKRWDQDSNNGWNLQGEYRQHVDSGDTTSSRKRKPSRSDRFREARASAGRAA